ncbi:nitroreductase [Mycobacterium sp. E3251]|uniref:nitroreductase n=1 Tax=unclassified Mycobacterium TaxID=2642494 RepID=UPI0008002404|nr:MULTISPECIES: nitroreductase [unclassified Mycobacterium]OBG93272.1 nitroreductase [Mycobacterium sp. E3251]OBI24996.1 nitroreductase [Mycobacterium sp. E1386]OBI26590.1 nitroreductase [Mycobacterium sp. E2238]
MSALLPEAWPKPLLGAIRVSNRYLLNPLMLRLAGRKHWYASVIHHTGRRSGKQFATPVVADRTASGFVIPLPYGTGVDWLQNVLAAGRASISCQGESYDVAQPEVIDAEAALPMLSADRKRTFARLGIAHYLKVSDASSPN